MKGNISKTTPESLDLGAIRAAADEAKVAADLAKKSAESVANKAEKDHTHTDYDTATLQAMYNEVIEPSPEEWFTFDSETQAITGLNEEYTEEYSGVTKLVFPYMIGGKSVKKIGEFAFLTEIDDSWSTSIPNMVNDIRLPNCIDSIGSSAFSNAPIKSINIPTSCYMIGSYAFEFCQSLEEVITPIKPNWELKIGSGAFHNCQSLRNIDTIIDGTKEIPAGAFSYTDIENVIIPESVEAIGYYAFECSSLRNITFLNKNCILDDNWCGTEYLELIKGYKGSTAETYAKNTGIPFMSIEGTEVLDKQPSDFIIHAEYVDSDDTNPSIRANSTFAELSEAYNNGRNIRVLLGNINLSMSSSNSINFTFSCIYNGKDIIVTCNKWNGWLCEHIVHIDLIKSEVQSKENELIEVLDEVLNRQENHSDTTWIPPIHPVFPSPSEPSIPDIDFEI